MKVGQPALTGQSAPDSGALGHGRTDSGPSAVTLAGTPVVHVAALRIRPVPGRWGGRTRLAHMWSPSGARLVRGRGWPADVRGAASPRLITR